MQITPLVRIVSGVVAGMAALTWLHYRPPWRSTETGLSEPKALQDRDHLTVGFLPVT